MEQMSLASGFELMTKRTRKRVFLDGMDKVIRWSDVLALIAAHAPEGKTGRPPFAAQVMLRIHLLQQFFGYSDPAMEEAPARCGAVPSVCKTGCGHEPPAR